MRNVVSIAGKSLRDGIAFQFLQIQFSVIWQLLPDVREDQ